MRIFKKEQQIFAAKKAKKTAVVLKNAKYLNVFTNEFIKADIAIENGKIVGIGSYEGENEYDYDGKYIVPSFIDSHMHLESSIVSPRQYSKAVLTHGTQAVVADPHEIGNVLGEVGIDYILDSTQGLPIDIFIMMPSCVPATPFDESGATIDNHMIKDYLANKRVLGLAEFMNYPGVINCDYSVLKKIDVTNEVNKVIDGHAPGLHGTDLNAYITAGVSSDHECSSLGEAKEKMSLGQWIMIREGTACKNLEALVDLLHYPYSSRCLFATDDKHPSDLINEGHIDFIIRKAISLGADPIECFKAASLNSANYFKIPYTGAIAPGYIANLVVLDDINSVKIDSCFLKGVLVSKNNMIIDEKQLYKSLDSQSKVAVEYISRITNTLHYEDVKIDDILIKKDKEKVIGLVPKEILTTDQGYASKIDVENDILKLCVVERHNNTGHIGVCFVKGYGLKNGAIATSIAHDSHNVIATGTNDADIVVAINRLKKLGGGMVVVNNGIVKAEFALPIAGLMTTDNVYEANKKITNVKNACYELGVNDNIDPFMTLSFTSLAVIPTLRLTTLGVVDVTKFELI